MPSTVQRQGKDDSFSEILTFWFRGLLQLPSSVSEESPDIQFHIPLLTPLTNVGWIRTLTHDLTGYPQAGKLFTPKLVS
jgi:hypothetical protein